MLLESSALKWRISQTQLICLEETYIFLDLDCPASARQLSDLGWQSRSWKMKVPSRQINFVFPILHF